MGSFRDSLLMKVSSLTEKLEERIFSIYDHHNQLIQEKLHEFSETTERIRRMETELQQVCHTMEMAFNDLCSPPEPSFVDGERLKAGDSSPKDQCVDVVGT
uniref:Synaptonemal complex central element protein 2 n=1 Tax=Sphenodon punctatus TaxID=8508 RepID=A0A8D0H8Q5_SPHPU